MNKFLDLLNENNPELYTMSRADVHARELYSIVLKQHDDGRLTRAFVAMGEVKPFDIQLHTHAYNIDITAVNGLIRHHIAIPASLNAGKPCIVKPSVRMPVYNYRSMLREETVENRFVQDGHAVLHVEDYYLPPGGSIYLYSTDIHTVSCSAKSIWIIEEGNRETEDTKFYGIPFHKGTMYRSLDDSPREVDMCVRYLRTELERMVRSL
jgi:hypothetical protein